jgi:hypothetical protein
MTPDRSAVRRLFTFRVNRDRLERRPVRWPKILVAAVVGALIGAVWAGQWAAILLAVAGAGSLYALDRALAGRDLAHRRGKKEANHAEFERLANTVRKIQANDVRKALLRVFERTQIPRGDLVQLQQTYQFSRERELFAEEKIEDVIGDLHNKSVRLISRGDFSNKAIRKVRWPESKREELFFNPIRLVTLFLAETQMVICDVQLDSMDGDLREEIQRIALSKIVSIRLTAERTRYPLRPDELAVVADDLGYTAEQIAEMQTSVNAAGERSPWVHEEISSVLGITLTDGGSLSMPIRSELYFGRHQNALDQDAPLTDDEITVDCMVNELSRLVAVPFERPMVRGVGGPLS